jgi:hypothetical protein
MNKTPNTLTITVTDGNSFDISATMPLQSIQKVYEANKSEDNVKDAVYGVFKQLIDRMKNPPKA